MANKYGPKINDNGLVFCLDAASKKTYPTDGLDVEYLVVAGGGGGGSRDSGAGGAGGLLTGAGNVTIATGTYNVVVGAGGAAGVGNGSGAGNGSDSSFLGTTSTGGGRGGQYPPKYAATGGSGGGGHNGAAGANGTAGQGNKGGDGNTPNSSYNGGGGGGAGGEGGDSLSDGVSGGDGGIGRYFGDKYGTSLGDDGWFAGGGGAGGEQGGSTDGTGGKGGGGDGHITAADDGQANTGGGGGSNRNYVTGLVAGNGGSGVVIIRYNGPPRAKGGDLIFNHRGYTVHVFNSSGSFILGETAADLSNSKIFGNFENMSSSDYSTGNAGYFGFDGSNQAINIPNFDVSTLGGNFTLCSLMKPISSVSLIFSSLDVSLSSSTKNFSFYFYETASYGISANAMRLQFGRSSWAWQVYGSNGLSLSKNNWYFVAVSAANLDTSTHTIKFYVNDQVINGTKWTGSTAAPINYGGDISNSTFLARNYTASAPTYANSYHEINIANLQIYNRTLSDGQVLDNFNSIRGRYGL
jgi:hypothetical protein